MLSVFQAFYLLLFVCWMINFIIQANGDRVTYVSVEHPVVEGYNEKYMQYVNLTSWRYGRKSPIYYVGFNYRTNISWDNRIKVDFYFYEFLTNRYHRSFVEMHFKFCDLVHKDMFFGAALKQGKLDAPCPYPPGEYNLANMTILPEAIPPGFPFTKGRIYANLTYGPTKEYFANGWINMEIRQIKLKERSKNSKL